MKLSLELLRCQRTFVVGISFAVLLVLSTEEVSYRSQTELIVKLDFVKYCIKSCSQMYILCLLHPFTPLLHIHCSHITHQHRGDYSPSGLPTQGTSQITRKKITQKKKSSSLTCVTYFFWLFRNSDLKSHSITCQGYAFPIHCSQLLLTFSPCWPTQVGLPAQLNSMGTVWARTSIFENPLQSAHTLEHFFHYPLENSPRR